MASPSSVLTQGLGSWGSSSLLLTLGLGSGTAVVVEDEFFGGSGYPVYKKFVRKPSIKEFLDMAMDEVYEEATAKTVPQAKREAFAKIVKPYTKSKAKVPETESINWKALQQDIERVDQLFELWKNQLNDEEQILLMAYEEFY